MNGKKTRVQNERLEPTFYARIPKMCIMDLNPYELALYCNYKQTASDDGYCDKSNTKLAKETHMSVGKVKQAKKSLEDKHLITVEHRRDKSGIENQTTYIKIVDVWQINHNRYAVEGGHVVTTPSHTVTTGRSLKNQGVVTERPQRITSEEEPIKEPTQKSAEVKVRKANPMFDAVAQYVFGIAPELVKEEGGRIGIISSWLSGKSDGPKRAKVGYISAPAAPEHVKAFAGYWKSISKANMPYDLQKFVDAWRKWASQRKATPARITPLHDIVTPDIDLTPDEIEQRKRMMADARAVKTEAAS